MEDKIRVVLKETGQTGLLDPKDFDENMFERIGEQTALASTPQGTRATDVGTGITRLIKPQATQPERPTTEEPKVPRIGEDRLFQVMLDPEISSGMKTNILKLYELQKERNEIEDPSKLRKEFSDETDNLNFIDMRNNFDKIRNSQDTAAGDLSMIFSYMKLLDPTSVVREGEQATAQNTAGVPDRIRNLYNRVNTGERLTPEQREGFRSQARELYNATAERQKDLVQFFSGQAMKQGLDPEDIVGLIGEIETFDETGDTRTLVSKEGIKQRKNMISEFFSSILPKEGDPKNFGESYARGLVKKGLIDKSEEKKTAEMMNLFSGAAISTALTGDLKAIETPRISELFTKKKAVETIDKLRGSTPTARAGQQQAASAAKSKAIPDVSEIVKAGDFVSKADSSVARAHAKEAPLLNNIKTVSDLLDRMKIWGSGAYTRSGGVKSSAKAQLFNSYYGAGLEILKKQAPEVYQDRQLLRLVLELPKAAGKALWRATLGKVLLQ